MDLSTCGFPLKPITWIEQPISPSFVILTYSPVSEPTPDDLEDDQCSTYQATTHLISQVADLTNSEDHVDILTCRFMALIAACNLIRPLSRLSSISIPEHVALVIVYQLGDVSCSMGSVTFNNPLPTRNNCSNAGRFAVDSPWIRSQSGIEPPSWIGGFDRVRSQIHSFPTRTLLKIWGQICLEHNSDG